MIDNIRLSKILKKISYSVHELKLVLTTMKNKCISEVSKTIKVAYQCYIASIILPSFIPITFMWFPEANCLRLLQLSANMVLHMQVTNLTSMVRQDLVVCQSFVS